MRLEPFASTEGAAYSPEFRKAVLEQVRLELQEYMAPELLDMIRMDMDRAAGYMGKHLAYRIQLAVYGREVAERTEETYTRKEEERKEEPAVTLTDTTIPVPLTWLDALKHTWLQWVGKKLNGNRLSRWLNLHVTVRWNPIKTTTRNIVNVTVRPITKHYTVTKHWHTCPHKGVPSNAPQHLEFLMDDVRIT